MSDSIQIRQLRRECLRLRVTITAIVLSQLGALGAALFCFGHALQLMTYNSGYAWLFGILGGAGIGVVLIGASAVRTNLALQLDTSRLLANVRRSLIREEMP